MEIGARVTKHQVALSAPLSLRSCGTRAGCPAAQRLGAGLVPRSRLPAPGCVCAHRLARPHFPTTRVAFEGKLRRKVAVQVPGMAGLGRRPSGLRGSPRGERAPFLPRRRRAWRRAARAGRTASASPWDPSSVPAFTSRMDLRRAGFQNCSREPPRAAAPRSCLVFSNLLPHVLWFFFSSPVEKKLVCIEENKNKPESCKVGAAVKHFKISSRAGSEFW